MNYDRLRMRVCVLQIKKNKLNYQTSTWMKKSIINLKLLRPNKNSIIKE